MTTPQVLTTAEVATRLNMTTTAFHQRHRALRDKHGFPPPVPGLGHRWDPEAITAWLARQRKLADIQAGVPEPPPQPANDIEAWQLELDRRAAQLAGRA